VTDPAAAQPGAPAHGRIALIGLAVLAVLTAVVWWASPWTARLQAAWFDAYQVMMPRVLATAPVTVVEIDERSLARMGQWPWPRTLLAELIRDIERFEPLAIGIDILMPEPDRLSPERLLRSARQDDPVLASRLDALPSNDSVLARAITAGPVVLPLAGTTEPTRVEPRTPPILVIDRAPDAATPGSVATNLPRFAGALANIAELDRVAAGHGFVSASPSEDVIRRAPMVVRVADRLVPSLATEMLRVALGAPDLRVYARAADVDAVAIGAFTARTETDGQVRIHYSKRDARRSVSAVDVLDGKVDASRLSRKLVLVATTGLALVDYAQTPLGERMPGSEVHAQLLENLYDQTWLTRPRWAPALEVAVFILLGLLLVFATPRWKPGNAALLALGCIAAPMAAGAAAFAWRGLVFDAAVPAVGLLLLFGVLLVLTLAEASRQRKALELAIRAQRERAAYVAGELEAAKRIQVGFLPRPDALADEPRVEIAAAMTPAREVGGDLYDFFRLDGDRVFFLVGDVAGKGLSASLFMAVGKALYKSITMRSRQATISELMQSANEELSRDNPEMFFITAFAGILDVESGALDYCNAGHDDPVVLSPDGRDSARLADGAGPPLCTVERFAYQTGRRQLRPGEVICVVTDGVADAQNPGQARYGIPRLLALLARLSRSGVTARHVVDAVRADVASFAAGAEPADDLTVLALRWNGPRAAAH
jgi:serine phosphatase RsbU (regulator of sigma subunit)/CHASE2 domain-containing sensor protein